MKIIKMSLLGILGGIGYALIAFYFLSPTLRNNLIAIAFWGLQGLTYSLMFLFLSKIVPVKKTNKHKNINWFLLDAIIGAISGLASGSYGLIITIYNTRHFSGPMSKELKAGINKQLTYYFIGYILLGVSVGLIIAYITIIKSKENIENKKEEAV